MLRSLLLLTIFGVCSVLSVIAVNELDLDRAGGNVLEAIFGRISDEDDIAALAIIGLSAAWIAFGVTACVPAWRRRLYVSLWAWPLKNRPAGSFFLRTGVFALLATSIFAITGGLGLESIVPVFVSIFAYAAMVLHDFHGMLLRPDYLHAQDLPEAGMAAPGWILPDTITTEMIGKPELRYELAKDLRKRASNMRRFSLIALAGIAALLVVAVNVILFAGFIANLGVGQTGAERIQALLDTETLALNRVEHEIAQNSEARATFVPNQVRLAERSTRKKLDDDEIKAIAERAERSAEYRKLAVEGSQLVILREAHSQAIQTILSERTNYLQNAIQSDFGAADQANNLNLLIASGITRFGILFIMLFIVQILVNLYRYTMRMSAYYLSQADALLLAEDNGDGLLKVVPVLSPQEVDFGKAPQTPVQNLEKILELAARLR